MSPELLRSYLQVCRSERVLRAQIPVEDGPLVVELAPEVPELLAGEPPVAGGWKTLRLDEPTDLDPYK